MMKLKKNLTTFTTVNHAPKIHVCLQTWLLLVQLKYGNPVISTVLHTLPTFLNFKYCILIFSILS